MNYYERHLGDYARDTGHLTLLEHGVYTVLLDRYYATEQGIAQADTYRVARATSRQERQAVDRVLAEFFALEDGVYRMGRVEREIAHYREKSGKASASAKARWSKSKGNANASANALRTDMRTHSDGNALQTPSTSSEAKASGADAPQQPSGQEPPDPKKALWDLGVSILGEKSRPVIGAACKRVGEQRVAEVFAQMAADPKADPVAWFVRVTSDRPARLVV